MEKGRYARTALQTGDKSRRSRAEESVGVRDADDSQPVTFVSSQSFLSLPEWDARRNGSISLKFRTNEGTGVLIFSHGIKNTAANGDSGDSNDEYFAIELLSGHVFLLMNMGSGAMKVKSSTRRLDDGTWHSIHVVREGRTGRVSVDDNSVAFIAPVSSADLSLQGSLYVGAVGTTGFHTDPVTAARPPVHLWSASLGRGFVGCVKDLLVNGQLQDLAAYALRQDSGGVRIGCKSSSRSRCFASSCQNGGTCVEGWNRRICVCAPTGYTGPNCAKESLILSFSGDQFFKFALPRPSVTQAEDLYLRFRSMKSSGLILAGVSETLVNFLVIFLDSGRLKVLLNLGEGSKVTQIGYNLNDDMWHSLKVERRGPWLEIKLHPLQQVAEITGILITLQIDSIYLGSIGSDRLQALGSTAPESALYHTMRDMTGFTGLIQSVIFNGKDLIELSRCGQIAGMNESTAVLDSSSEREQIEYSSGSDAVTFKSKWTFVALPQMKAYSQMRLFFQFKTLTANGLILFNSGQDDHFVAIEIQNGRIVYSFNLGEGAKRLVSGTRFVSDNVWHSVAVHRSIFNQHSLRVDEETVTLSSSPGANTHLVLRSLLYLGGVPADMFAELPNTVQSTNGYEGCFANIDFNDELIDPTDPEAIVIGSTLVSSGCSYAPFSSASPFTHQKRCPLDTCFRQGVCVKYADGELACDCDQSSFTSASCSEEGTSFRFGHVSPDTRIAGTSSSRKTSVTHAESQSSDGGSVTVNFPDGHQIDTKSDTLSLGVVTGQTEAFLLRVSSRTTGDYMELQIVGSKVLMAYNLGIEDHLISDDRVPVADNKYHIIKFTRSGANSTLQIDSHNAVSRAVTARKQMTVFDTLATIQIGARREKKQLPPPALQTPPPLVGIISGLTFNGMMILDLAEERDERISIEGDVSVVHELPKRFNPNNMNSLLGNLTHHPLHEHSSHHSAGQKDGLQVCWADSQCQHSHTPDDSITRLMIATTTVIPAARTEYTEAGKEAIAVLCNAEDDDEDCAEGSGDDADREEDGEEDREEDVDERAERGEEDAVTPEGNFDVSVDERSASSTATSRPVLPITGTFLFIPPSTAASSTTIRSASSQTTTRTRFHTTTSFIDPRDLEQTYRPRSTGVHTSRPKTQLPKPGVQKTGFHGIKGDNNLSTGKERGNQHPVSRKTSFSSADQTALVIGVIATVFIVLVFVAPILLFAKLRMMNQFPPVPPSMPSSTHINSHMVYSQSGLGICPSGSKSVPAPLIAADTSSLLHSSHALPVSYSPLLHHNQPEHQHYHQPQSHGTNIISGPGPTSILKKKKDCGHEWYV